MLVQKNLELTKRIEKLEAQLKSITQDNQNDLATNSSEHVANDDQEQKNNTAGLHLVFKLR